MEYSVFVSTRVYKAKKMGNGDRRFFFIQLDHYLAQIGTDQDFFSWR
jgi:hypothetical protein